MRISVVQSILFRLRSEAETRNTDATSGFSSRATARRTVLMRRGDLIRLTRRSAVECIEVRRGLIWLTGTPGRTDVLLREGDQFWFSGGWPFIIEALDESEVVFRSQAK
jgi:hypothetical protein